MSDQPTILVVDDDELVLRAIGRQLGRSGMQVVAVTTLNEALPHLLSDKIDVLLTDLRLGAGEGTELLWVVQNNALKTRSIMMSGHAGHEEERLAFELGAVAMLSKPFAEDALLQALKRALAPPDGFSGDLACLTLVDVLQMYHQSQRSVVVELAGPSVSRIFFEHGQIVHAVCGNVVGEDAFRQILRSTHGRMRGTALHRPPRRTIERRFEALLLDGLRVIDEEKAALSA